MRINKIELRHLRLPLVAHFETSFGRVNHQETLIIKITAGNYDGYGECPASAAPYYSSETIHTARYIIKEFLTPILFKLQIADCRLQIDEFNRIRGHPMAKAGVLMALSDLIARRKHSSLSRFYGGTRKTILSGISLGIQDSLPDLFKRIDTALQVGYQRIKIKIKPGWDVRVVAAVRKRFGHIPLSVDANGVYQLKDAPVFRQLDKYNLLMIEQPLDYNDLIDHAKLQRHLKTPLCLDESIKSLRDTRQAIELGSCRIINIKQARVGGPFEAKNIHNRCRHAGIPVWCGGLLETGIGRLHNIALASLPGFTLPGDISASARYYKKDIIDPSVVVSPAGTIRVPQEPGLGARVITRHLQERTISKETLT